MESHSDAATSTKAKPETPATTAPVAASSNKFAGTPGVIEPMSVMRKKIADLERVSLAERRERVADRRIARVELATLGALVG